MINFYKYFILFSIVVLSIMVSGVALAIEPPTLQIDIGQSLTPADCGDTCQVPWIGQYVSAIYKYGVGLAVVLAILMIMIGGFVWLLSGGSPDKITTAKSFITGSLSGLALALFSFVILQTINPNLVSFQALGIKTPDKLSQNAKSNPAEETITSGCCYSGDYNNCRDMSFSGLSDSEHKKDCAAAQGESGDVFVSYRFEYKPCKELYGCSQYTSPSDGLAGIGEGCSSDADCSQGLCYSGGLFTRAKCIAVRSLSNDTYCDNDQQCKSGHCPDVWGPNFCRNKN